MDLNLRAGDLIHIKPGTHFMAGAKVHAKIEYFPCHIYIPPPDPNMFDSIMNNGGSMLEPMQMEMGDESSLANNTDVPERIEVHQLNHAHNETVLPLPKKNKQNVPATDVQLVAIKENEIKLKILQL
jgi:hypothetical protein